MKKILFACFSLLILGTSCKKSGSESGYGGEPFMSFSPGSEWEYKLTNVSSSTSSTYKLTATDQTKLIGGKNYTVFTNSQAGAQPEYYNNTGENYYQLYNLFEPVIPSFEFRYLVSNKTMWEDLFSQQLNQNTFNLLLAQFNNPLIPENSSGTITTTLVNVEEGSNLNITVNNINYSNIKKIKTTFKPIKLVVKRPDGLTLPAFDLTDNSSSITSYYAPKFGLIKRETILNLSIQGASLINLNTLTELQNSLIK